ncbi:MAG: nitroreductase family protein [Promethearchaeota archaeon]
MKSKYSFCIDVIKSRKSIRNFEYKKLKDEVIIELLECGRWAPSGNNNQPWFVCVVTHPTVKRLLAEQTKYSQPIIEASVVFVVFLDKERCYDRTKDLQSIGAFAENILLGAHSMGLGGVWIGEILNNKEKINEIFKLSVEKYELMYVLAIGAIAAVTEEDTEKPERIRRELEEFTTWY